MSQHLFAATPLAGKPVTVILGYDRVLNYVFCTVTVEEEIVYSNLADPEAGTDQQNIEYFRPVLQELGVTVPESMFVEVTKDQLGRVGNRTEVHRAED